MHSSLRNKKLIIFDFDDTLVQTMNCKWNAIIETGRRKYNLTISPETIKTYWGNSYREMLSGVFGDVDSIDGVVKNYEEITTEFPMTEHKGAVSTLKELLINFKISIMTASGRNVVLDDLERLGFPLNEFLFIQTSEDTYFHKPDPRVFEPIFTTLAKEKIDKNEIIYIGDALKDYIAAKKAGIDFLGVLQGSTTVEEFENVGAKYVYSLPELLK